ncbi:MAG: hypothetical protein IJ213_02575 [Bacteroidales bacterium]|nr:hypothetical protein [Bacteroidales bacterium]
MDSSDTIPLPKLNLLENIFTKVFSILFHKDTIPTWLVLILLSNTLYGRFPYFYYSALIFTLIFTLVIPVLLKLLARFVYKQSSYTLTEGEILVLDIVYFSIMTFLFKDKFPIVRPIYYLALLLPLMYKCLSVFKLFVPLCLHSVGMGVLIYYSAYYFIHLNSFWFLFMVIASGFLLTSRLLRGQTTLKAEIIGLLTGFIATQIYLILI